MNYNNRELILNFLGIKEQISSRGFYLPLKRLPQGLPWALLTSCAPAKPPMAPSRKLPVLPPNILLLVPSFLLPFLQGLVTLLKRYCPATPAAAPNAAESIAWLPVKNLVLVLPLFFVPTRLPLSEVWGRPGSLTRQRGSTRRF